MPRGVYQRRVLPPLERFEQRYIPEPMSGCFIWTGAYNRSNDYGNFGLASNCAPIGAHRAAWILYKGEIPHGLHVLHHCDNPACVNPDHLFLGTHSDNMRDCVRKGRFRSDQPSGENAGPAKLTAEQVRIIRRAKRRPNIRVELAAQFGVSVHNVAFLRSKRVTWVGVE